MDQKCTQLLPNEYLCKEAHTAYVSNSPPCAVQLITYQSNTTTCQPFHIRLQEVQITKISDGKWIVTVPSRLVVPISCKNSKDNTPLFGSYLIEASNQCSLQINSFILRTYKANQLTYKDVSLPELDLSDEYHQRSQIVFNPPTLDLNAVNLKQTKEIEANLQDQKRTSFWTILLYIIIVIICIFTVYKLYKNDYFKKPSINEASNKIII